MCMAASTSPADFHTALIRFAKRRHCWSKSCRWLTQPEWELLYPKLPARCSIGVALSEGFFCHLLAYPWPGQAKFVAALEKIEEQHGVYHEMLTCYATAWYLIPTKVKPNG